MVLNGAVSTAAEAGGSWQQAVMSALQSQVQAVQEDVYMQRLQDSDADLYQGEGEGVPRGEPQGAPPQCVWEWG